MENSKSNNAHTSASIMDRIKNQLNGDLVAKMEGLPPKVKADLNRITQKVLNDASKIGKVSLTENMKNHQDLMDMEAKFRKDYGADTSK